MKIAIIGRGAVGGALGQALSRVGHEITYGVRAPSAPDEALNAQAARRAQVVILATPWPVAGEASRSCGALDGVIVIDATNPLKMTAQGLALDPQGAGSGAQTLAGLAPGARLVKCFNQTGYETMADAAAYASKPLMMAASDDEEARRTALGLAAEIGFEAVDMGPLANAALLEACAMIWVEMAFQRGMGRRFALAVARPEGVASKAF